MTKMIERIARLLVLQRREYTLDDEWFVEPDHFLPGSNKRVWESFVPRAIQIIEAMREPTDEMIDAAKAPGVPPILVKAIYQAMIDAA